MTEMKDDNINLFPQRDAYWEMRDDGIAVRNPGGFHKTPEDLVAAYRASEGGMNTPMLKVAGLWAKTSVKGGQNLTGRLGGVKVLILENWDRQGNGLSHHLFFVEARDRRQEAQERGEGLREARTPPARRVLPQLRQDGFQGQVGADDGVSPRGR